MKPAIHLFGILLIAVIALAGCHELGHVDGAGDYGSVDGDIVGEIRSVDVRARQIEIQTDAGPSRLVRYDANTTVIYRQRDYAVADLERGDYVAMRAQQGRDGRLYTDMITVRESVQERGYSGRPGRLERVEGRVEYVDARRGTFEVRDRRDRLVVVSVAFNAPRSVSDRFRRLREGDYVRLEGQFINQDRFELESFF